MLRAHSALNREYTGLYIMHEAHIVFENLSIINGDMLQKAWGLEIGEDSMVVP